MRSPVRLPERNGEESLIVRMRIEVRGIVQGVGFRPFIHRLVSEYGFNGWVRNSSRGVDMELEGEENELRQFAARIAPEKPLLADVESVECSLCEIDKPFDHFEIIESRTLQSRDTLISPDIGICPDCMREMLDPKDKRYRYPFLNCTNCGPRFTIIKDIPYDRSRTSMSVFPMCPDCRREYTDISNRRYHAEPTCCPDCGPVVFFEEAGERLERDEAIERARKRLREGAILAVKGLGGLHLACLPEKAAELRTRKHRDSKPFALMCRNTACAETIAFVSEEERQRLESPQKPIVLLRKRDRSSFLGISENTRVGVMLPYTPLHVLLFGNDIDALIMTSANLSDKPILYTNEEARNELSTIADAFLLNERDIQTRCDDSLLYVVNGNDYFVRRSRGYVPYPVRVKGLDRNLLACGAEQKASFVISRGSSAFPSQHIGDLKNFETFENYQEQIAHFEHMFDITPEAIVCDMHPDYLSTQYAMERSEKEGIPLIPVQHHHAHMAACMADNDLNEPVIGIIWDGVGYGSDGGVWGGEFLLGDYGGFERKGHLRPLPLIGGDRAVKEIWRIGYALCRDENLYGEFPLGIATYQLNSGLNCPLSSGMGRLFDGAASLMDICQYASYEGEGAVLLEAAADEGCEESYPYEITDDNTFDYMPMVSAILSDRVNGEDKGKMAARFMNTLCFSAADITERIGNQSGVKTVVLSGGSFQNMFILSRLPRILEQRGFRVYTHRRVSCNDEGLSLGQLMIGRKALETKQTSPSTL